MLLTVNSGSSSLRLAAYIRDNGLQQLAAEHYELGQRPVQELLRQFLVDHELLRVPVVVHRVVHGGSHFSGPCRIDAEVEARIHQLTPLAPLHNPPALALIQACRKLLPGDTSQIAVFDTGFFHDLPDPAASYALPPDLANGQPLRRYGFHGLAHQAMWLAWEKLHPAQAQGRVISLQLGSGCSVSAIRAGKPLDTSMGFSPLEGLVMATRSGDLDPGLLLYLQQQQGLSGSQLDELLNRRSGLLGVSGLSADMRELLEAAAHHPPAQRAINLYCYRAAKYIGAYLTVLGGADSIVFGGGVGEHAAPIRAGILAYLRWTGLRLDAQANQAGDSTQRCISQPDSSIPVWVLPVVEQRLMAELACQLMAAA